MGGFLQDLRFAARLLRRSPGFSATALAAIALATGANSAVFSLAYSVILRPLPFREPSRLTAITQFYPSFKQSVVTAAAYLDWRNGLRPAARLAAYSMGDYTISDSGGAERLTAALVTREFFPTLGVEPFPGRNFTASEDSPGGDAVAIVSEGFWSERMGRSRDLSGGRIELDGRLYRIIGVLPAAAQFPPGARVWIPLALDPVRERGVGPMQLVRVIGRLAPAESPDGLASALNAISQRGATPLSAGGRVVTEPLHAWLTGKTRQVWLLLLGTVLLVLLVACANVAGLLIARGAARSREMAIRLALGARSGRLARQLLTESLLLAGAGSVIGLVLGTIAVKATLPLIPDAMLAGRPVRLDAPVFLFSIAVAAVAALLFGMAPARAVARVEPSEALKETHAAGRPGSAALRGALIVGEIALSLAVLVTAGLLTRSFLAIAAVDPGFRSDHALSFSVNLPRGAYGDAALRTRFFEQAANALADIPGVRGVGFTSSLPFGGRAPGWTLVTAEGEGPWDSPEGAQHRVQNVTVSAGYFRAAGVRVEEGRELLTGDENGRSAVVSRSLARRFFGNLSAVGRRLKIGIFEAPNPWLTIVGVVSDCAFTALDAAPEAALYRLNPDAGASTAGFVIRTAGEPARLAASARRAIARLDAAVAVSDVQTMERRLAASMASDRLRFLASAAFAALALAIVITGLYGVLSYLVTRRGAEFGIRMALGATPSSLCALVLSRGMALAAAGVGAGVCVSLVAVRLFSGVLFSVSPADPATLAGASLLMLAIAAGASLAPALRAARTDPIRNLRQE